MPEAVPEAGLRHVLEPKRDDDDVVAGAGCTQALEQSVDELVHRQLRQLERGPSSRSSPTSISSERRSTAPSEYASSVDPGTSRSTAARACSASPAASGGERPSRSQRASPEGDTTSSGGCPAEA